MDRRVLAFVALSVTMLYGVTVGLSDARDVIAPVGGVVVALSWIAVGMLGRSPSR